MRVLMPLAIDVITEPLEKASHFYDIYTLVFKKEK